MKKQRKTRQIHEWHTVDHGNFRSFNLGVGCTTGEPRLIINILECGEKRKRYIVNLAPPFSTSVDLPFFDSLDDAKQAALEQAKKIVEHWLEWLPSIKRELISIGNQKEKT